MAAGCPPLRTCPGCDEPVLHCVVRGQEFFKSKGMQHFEIVTADGALEAAPAMGVADIILDLVSSGTTLRENNLKEIDGGRVLESQVATLLIPPLLIVNSKKKKRHNIYVQVPKQTKQGVFVGSRKALQERPEVLDIAHEMLERLEAHLRAKEQYEITANMRAHSAVDAANKVLKQTSFGGLQGPTISRVFSLESSSNG